MQYPISELGLIFAAGGASFCAALIALAAFQFLGLFKGPNDAQAGGTELVLRFRGEDFVDVDTPAGALFHRKSDGQSDLGDAVRALTPRFPNLPLAVANAKAQETIEVVSATGKSTLLLETSLPDRRLSVSEATPTSGQSTVAPLVWDIACKELAVLRAAMQSVPFLVWKQSADGTIAWANQAYLNAAALRTGPSTRRTWPPATLFSKEDLAGLGTHRSTKRISTTQDNSGSSHWYDCSATPIEDGQILTAVEADAAVALEEERREFTQTITKTIAHLSTGIAVFDNSRRLVIFSPSLAELTMLPPEFLAARPTLAEFLDQLRSRQMIPEPRDYSGWRAQMAALEAAAEGGRYNETWSLANGKTYRVSGRPHGNGAVAFAIEDISAGMTLTRRFRAELDMGQGVLDSLDDAIAVFGPDGALSVTNRSYDKLWGVLDNGDRRTTVTEATRHWMTRCRPTPLWADLRDFVLHARERSAWSEDFCLHNGRNLRCRVRPLGAGATLVHFVNAEATDTPAGEARISA